MTLGDLRAAGIAHGRPPWRLIYRTGPFLIGLETDYRPVLEVLADLYADSETVTREAIVSLRVAVRRPIHWRRWWRPQIRFFLERQSPFEPYPLDHAFPLLEWGLNWGIAMRSHQYLMLHSGAVEREGGALVLPAMPGSGKSTLSAALSFRGWRLLSDEFGLYEPNSGNLAPLPRAVPLKNASIDVIRSFAPEAHLGPLFPKTRKGDVSHLRPPGDSLARQRETARPRWIVFPQYVPGQPVRLQPTAKSLAFTRLAQNSFNYQLLGRRGFDALVDVIRRCDCYSLSYGDLEAAVDSLNGLCIP